MANRPTSDAMHYPATSSVGSGPLGVFRPSRPGERRGGRAKGTPNRTTQELRAAILAAADEAHPDGTVGYLKWLATNNSAAFAALLGKVLPKEIEAGVNVRHTLEDFIIASYRHEAQEAGGRQGNTSRSHAAQSAPPIEPRGVQPPSAVIDRRTAVTLARFGEHAETQSLTSGRGRPESSGKSSYSTQER